MAVKFTSEAYYKGQKIKLHKKKKRLQKQRTHTKILMNE